MSVKRGSLIVFEGCDKVGKTLCCKLLKKHLKNDPVKFLSFPDRATKTGKLIDKCLRKKDNSKLHWLHLLFTANKFEKLQEILYYLESGIHVIIDRYVYSGIAYALASNLDYNWCHTLHTGLPKPDLTIMIEPDDVSNYTKNGELFETEEFQQKVKKCFKTIEKRNCITINTVDFVLISSYVKNEMSMKQGSLTFF